MVRFLKRLLALECLPLPLELPALEEPQTRHSCSSVHRVHVNACLCVPVPVPVPLSPSTCLRAACLHLTCRLLCRPAIHRDCGQRLLCGPGGPQEGLRRGVRRLEHRSDPLHAAVRSTPLLGW